jgi:hypothetical protein
MFWNSSTMTHNLNSRNTKNADHFRNQAFSCTWQNSALILIVLDGHKAKPGPETWLFKDGNTCNTTKKKKKVKAAKYLTSKLSKKT